MVLRQHFLTEQLSPPLSGPGCQADPLGLTKKMWENVFTFLDVSDQKEQILFFPSKYYFIINLAQVFRSRAWGVPHMCRITRFV